MFGRVIVGIILLFVILLATLPRSDDKSVSKIATASMLMCSKDFRSAVIAQLQKERVVTLHFENKCPGLIDDLQVDNDGMMVITNHEHHVKMTLKPVQERSGTRWSCKGEPKAEVTALCKE